MKKEKNFELTCELADNDHQAALRQLSELYKYDFTDYDPEDVNEDGRYEYEDLDAYRIRSGHYAFLLRADGKLAGFALIRRYSAGTSACGQDHVVGAADSASRLDAGAESYGHEMVEFFVMRKYRRSGLGSETAKHLFLRFPGLWKLKIMEENAPALAFWTRAIAGCEAVSGLVETRESDWDGPVLVFCIGEQQVDVSG